VIAVRAATDADVAFLVAAQSAPHARGFVLAATDEQVRAALINPDRATFVFTDDGEPAGMVLLSYFPDAPWLVELRRIVVTRPGRGIGTHALRWTIAHAFEERNAHRISLDVVETNDRARRLYERCGFIHEGTQRDGYRSDDGHYGNLCSYGLLATDPHERTAGNVHTGGGASTAVRSANLRSA
jgi:RimJ/RimL family protein N-acetyltransferase